MSNPLHPVPPITPDEPEEIDELGMPADARHANPDDGREESSDDDDADHVEGVDPDLQV